MKVYHLLLPILLLVLVAIYNFYNFNSNLKTGDLLFISLDGQNEQFEIITANPIKPNTIIHFTDSEWNGNHFGKDESNLIWNTGKYTIPKGKVIQFKNLANQPFASIGSLKNTMKISKERDAIFAYLGTNRMPTIFLAAVANNKLAFGTLINTNLKTNKSAVILKENDQTPTINTSIAAK